MLVTMIALMAATIAGTAGTASAHTSTGGPEAHNKSDVHAHLTYNPTPLPPGHIISLDPDDPDDGVVVIP